MKKIIFASLLLAFCCCNSDESSNMDSLNADVPKGDPAFTPLTTSWVIDKPEVMDEKYVSQCHSICKKLQDDGIAEMVVLIQNGVKHPADYSTHYGRFLKLGKKGQSTQGGNNGIVWLIRPDAEEKMTYSIGRGLPLLTSDRMVDIINKAKDYINFNNYDSGVLSIVQETDKTLRGLYKKGAK